MGKKKYIKKNLCGPSNFKFSWTKSQIRPLMNTSSKSTPKIKTSLLTYIYTWEKQRAQTESSRQNWKRKLWVSSSYLHHDVLREWKSESIKEKRQKNFWDLFVIIETKMIWHVEKKKVDEYFSYPLCTNLFDRPNAISKCLHTCEWPFHFSLFH